MMDALSVGLVVKVKDRATRIVAGIGRAFDRLKQRGQQLARGLRMVAQGAQTFAMAGAAVAAGLGFAANTAANFEQQMSNVRSVMQGVSDQDFSALQAEVMRLGATTSKSATEAGEGAEMLARAGFSAQESIAALSGVIALAEADSLDLATATNVTANTVRAFGLAASEATNVADTLALTSARTNTNVSQLGEALRYAAPKANELGQSVQDTSFALGMLANMGLQGSTGGTALRSMMAKLTRQSSSTAAEFRRLGIQFQDAHGNMLPMGQVIENISNGLESFEGNVDRAAFLQEAFGIRGSAAASNLSTAMRQMQDTVEVTSFDDMGREVTETVTRFEALRREINNADGAARRMADERLNNLKGAFTLLSSAIEGASISAFSGVVRAMTPGVRAMADAIAAMAEGMNRMGEIMNGADLSGEADRGRAGWLRFGAGIRLAMNEISAVITKVGEIKDAIMAAFGPSGATATSLGRILTWGAVITAVVGTIVGGLLMIVVPLIAAKVLILKGLAIIAAAVMPVVYVFGFFIAYIQATRREGQSFSDRLREVFAGVAQFASDFFRGFKDGYDTFIKPAFQTFKAAISDLFLAFKPIFDEISLIFGDTGRQGYGMGEIVAGAFGIIIDMAATLVRFLTPVISWIVNNFIRPFVTGIGQIITGFTGLLTGARGLRESLGRILQGVVNILLNTVLRPFKALFLALFQAMNYVGLMSDSTLAAATGFLNAAPGTLLGNAPRSAEGQSAAGAQASAARRDAGASGQQAAAGQPPTVRGRLASNTTVNVDGRQVARATARQQFTLSERGGFNMNPWQTRTVRDGGMPAGTTA